ncbi:uncharacterized protein LOC101896492 [Musca domestica]|uniref:Uncharacterized protein LOC101896492 n=1 Tax=Musca domestica TaxID=7370 RepID=A0A1I8NBK2_MUSDO|nr:uncharacterized protein LOC101896492 [Musca domestica]
MTHFKLPNGKLLGALALLMAFVLETTFAAGIDCSMRPPMIDPLTCCPVPDIISEDIMTKCRMAMPRPPPPPPGYPYADPGLMYSDEDSSSMSNESKQPKTTGPPNRRPPHPHYGPPPPHMQACFLYCALNETGILPATPDAKLNENKLSTYLKEILANATDMIPIMESSFKTCAVKVEEMSKKFKEHFEKKAAASASSSNESKTQDRMMRPPPPLCPHAASHLMGCVFKESFINCPSSLWSNTEQCNEIRDHMKNCKANKMKNGKLDKM